MNRRMISDCTVSSTLFALNESSTCFTNEDDGALLKSDVLKSPSMPLTVLDITSGSFFNSAKTRSRCRLLSNIWNTYLSFSDLTALSLY